MKNEECGIEKAGGWRLEAGGETPTRVSAYSPRPAVSGLSYSAIRNPQSVFLIRRSFVLLEVLVSLAVLGISLTMIMKSLTASLKAAKWSQQITTATVLARGLIEKWEIEPPAVGLKNETFAPDYPQYSYELKYEPEDLSYENLPEFESESAVSPLRRVSVRILVAPGGSREGARKEVLRFESALIDSEIFEPNAKLANGIRFE